ncbi:MAG: lipocalin family protein [Mariniphaga sp.]
MNKILLIIVFPFLFLACKSTAPSAGTSPKLDKSSQLGIKGNWQITNISYPGSDYFKVNSFQIADSKCFIGSTWNFIPNNNKGSITLNQSNCPPFSSPIVWSIDKQGIFGLKIVEPGIKAKAVTQGYYLKVSNQTSISFQLIDVIDVAGQKKDIVYQFEKIN